MSEEVYLTPEDITLVQELSQARSIRSEWEAHEKKLRAMVIQRLKEHGATRGLTASGAPCVHISTSVRHTVDSKKLEALYPEIYAEVMKETPVEKLDLDR